MKPWLAFALALLCAVVVAQTAAPPTARLRGTIERIEGNTLVMKERSGEVVTLVLADDLAVTEVRPTELSAIREGSFVGIASLPGVEGRLTALEVLVFPEAARGTGEGHYPWDLVPGSMMTNATVAELAAAPQGRTLTLRYKDGEQTVVVPANVPVVTLVPADRSLLVRGAKLMVTAQERQGRPTALRALVGRDGFTPPM